MARGKRRTKKEIDELMELAKPYFLLGRSVNSACECAMIPTSTFKDILTNNENLRRKVVSWQNMSKIRASEILISSLNDDKVLPRDKRETAKWLLERIDKQTYSTRVESVEGSPEDFIDEDRIKAEKTLENITAFLDDDSDKEEGKSDVGV